MVIIRLLLGFIGLVAALWAPFNLLRLGRYCSRMNKRIKDGEGLPPDEVRNRSILLSQVVSMGVINLAASTLAGISGSQFVRNGHLYWPSSTEPIGLFVAAAALIEFPGAVIVYYVSRPTQAWIYDSSMLRSYLKQVDERGSIGSNELVEIEKRRAKWDIETNASPLRSVDELSSARLWLPAADEEWRSRDRPVNRKMFGKELMSQVTTKQVRHWIRLKRLWSLGVAPLISGLTLAWVLRGAIGLASIPTWLSISLYFPLAAGCLILLYWWAFRVGRLELVMVNRLFALERSQLGDCDKLIEQIREWHSRQKARVQDLNANIRDDRLVLRVGRWDLSRKQRT